MLRFTHAPLIVPEQHRLTILESHPPCPPPQQVQTERAPTKEGTCIPPWEGKFVQKAQSSSSSQLKGGKKGWSRFSSCPECLAYGP